MNEIMNSIANFTNINFGEVRVWTDENGNPWFFGVDICRALGYARPRKAISQNVDNRDVRVYEKGTVPPLGAGVPYGMQDNTEYLIINEAGLYQLVCRSHKPEARAFFRWLTDEVLPSIRKNGLYIQRELLEDNERLNQRIEEYRVENEGLRAENARMKPGAEYFDNYMANKEYTMCITQIATMHGLTAQRLHKILHENGVIRKVRGQWEPTAKYNKSGYMVRVMYEYRNPGDPHLHHREVWEWTPEGEYFIYRLLSNLGYVMRRQPSSRPWSNRPVARAL